MMRTWLLASLLLASCLDVAEERARRDLTIGHQELDGARVDVRDGLAAIRAFSPGRLELWANAPSLEIELALGPGAPREWSVVVRNTLPDAELALASADRAVTPSPRQRPLGTEREIALSAEPNARIRLTLAAPDAAAAQPFDFIEFADVQDAIDRVQDIFERMNQVASARFVVMAGDITEQGDADQLERFQREQRALRLPIFVTLGNHELGDGEVPYHRYFGRGSQSFTFASTRFTLLDSASATIDPMVYGWLDGWLEAARGSAHLVFMHIPPIEPIGLRNGAFSNRAEANKLLARLGRGGVLGTFYGHIHSYYAFHNVGIPAFISGGGGAIPERFDGIGRHFLVVTVDPARRTLATRVVRVD